MMKRETASNGMVSLNRLYDRTLRICDDLEEIADTLPNPDRRLCRRLAIELDETVSVVIRREERDLFPLLTGSARAAVVARLREEHAQDRSAAADIARALTSISRGRAKGSYDAIGYMLRAYFLGVRRHVAFEQTLLAAAKAAAAPQ